jgi:hypothetical protein
LAAEVRLNLHDYTIAVNGSTWEKTYPCVWAPAFNPSTGVVVAPVRTAGRWSMASDGQIIWPHSFVQLWHQQFNDDGSKLAAIVAPKYGRWTVAVDGTPWSATFKDMVMDVSFSPDGQCVAALAKEGDQWMVAVDGRPWRQTFEMAWKPVFSPDSRSVAAKVEKGGRYTLSVDDHLWSEDFDMIWEPIFSPGGDRLLVRSLEKGVYRRQIIPVSTITG